MQDVASRAVRTALMADGHVGYVMPIGGVAAYRERVSVVGVGFDIACGNAAVRTDLTLSSLGDVDDRARFLGELANEIQHTVSFGIGRHNRDDDAPVDHPLFLDPAWEAIPAAQRPDLRHKARGQLGTVGSGNHYVDVFVDDSDHLWVGVHFGSRGFGHTIASAFLALSQGKSWGERAPEREVLRPVASVPMAEPCGGMAVDFGALWVVNCKAGTLVRVDVASNRVIAEIPTGVADPSGEVSVATGAGSVWLLSDSAGVLSRIDPVSNTVVARIRVQPHSFAAAFGFGSVWISTTGHRAEVGPGSVQRIDPATNAIVATITVGPAPRFLAAGEGGVWTLNQGDGTVSRIDPATNTRIATIATAVPGSGGRDSPSYTPAWGARRRSATMDLASPGSLHNSPTS